MLNSFELVKQTVTPRQVATKYLGSPDKGGNTYMYKSPFRNEKTASFAVSDIKGFTDFASGWHSDMFGFVKELYSLSNRYVALKVIAKDFGIDINEQSMNKEEYIKAVKKNAVNKVLDNGLDRWFDTTYDKLCRKYREINCVCNKFRRSKSKRCIYKMSSKLFVKEAMLDAAIDSFLEIKDMQEKLQLFKQRKEIEKLL